MRPLATLVLLAAAAAVKADFWMNEVEHQGLASFNPDKSYQVFRNVKDFGAKGDGGWLSICLSFRFPLRPTWRRRSPPGPPMTFPARVIRRLLMHSF